MKKTILLSLMLALAIANANAYTEVAGFDGPTWYDYRATTYAGGNGRESSPYLISTPEQLAKLAYEVNVNGAEGYYKLTANISLNKRIDGERVLWVPVGIGAGKPFKGTLTNPDGFVIEDMMIKANSTETTSYFGLFGYVTGTVDGVILENAQLRINGITELFYAGLICGELHEGSMKNCSTKGAEGSSQNYSIITVEGITLTPTKPSEGVAIGGLVGFNSGYVDQYDAEHGRMASCVARTQITLKGNGASCVTAGGIVGHNYGKMLDCHAVVDMTATDFSTTYIDDDYLGKNSYLGGIIGKVLGGPVKFCSASGDIRAGVGSNEVTGGAFGYVNTAYNDIKMDYCVSTVAISGGHTLGGLIGYCYVQKNLAINMSYNFSASYIDARDATYAGGMFGHLEYNKNSADSQREGWWLAEGGRVSGFCGTMKRPNSSEEYGVILGHTIRVPKANFSRMQGGTGQSSHFYYNGKMCNFKLNGKGYAMDMTHSYGGQIPNEDGYGIYGISYGGGSGTLEDPSEAARYNGVTADRLEMCFTDNYKLCCLLFYITNDKKTNYCATDVTVDFSIEDITNSSTGEKACSFTVPDNVTCVRVEDKHLYPLDPGEVVVTIKWNGLQRKVHLDITYGLEWPGGGNASFEGGNGTAENPYLIHNAKQLYSATHDSNLNKSDKYYKLACDIFFNTHLLQEDGRPRYNAIAWDPVDFHAHLDGNGKTIYGLYVNKVSTADNQSFGLFANLYGSVENLAIVDSHVEVDSKHEGINVGMLCGSMKDGTSVSNCLMHGNVVSDANRGGLCGNAQADNISITDIFSCVHVCQPGWPPTVTSADYSGGVVCYVSQDVMERCFSIGRVEDYSPWSEGIANTDAVTDCYYDVQMMDYPRVERDFALTTNQILSRKLYEGKERWQQDDERYPMLKTFADTPYGKMLAMPVLFDGTDCAGNVNYIFEFPTDDVSWSALNNKTYLDVINECGAASIVKETGDNVEILIAQAENVESQCTRAMRTMPLNLRSGLTSFRFKDPVAQSAAEAAFDKDHSGILILRELVEASKQDFAVFNANATGLKNFPEFRYFTNTTTLEEGMLSGLGQLSELQLPKKLTTIDGNAFYGCSSLDSITMPKTFTTLNEGGLYGSGIKNLLVHYKHPNMRSIAGALFQTDNDGNLHLVAYPPGRGEEDATISTLFHYIDDYAFYKIPNLKNIYIDNCLPEGNYVDATDNEIPIVPEEGTEILDIYVNDGSWGTVGSSYGPLLFSEYEDENSFWGYYYEDHLHIYYPLSMTSAGWATLYIGFPTRLPEGFNAYVVTVSDDDEKIAKLKNIGRVIPKTTPVVIKNTAGLAPGIYPLTRWEGAVPNVPKYDNRFVGTYIGQEGKWGLEVNQETSITGGVLTLGRNSKGVVGFYKYNGAVIPPYRAYLTTNTVIEGAKGFTFVIDDTIDETPTAIQNAPSLREQQSSVYYDMTGRALQGTPTRPGVYIKNGKRFVVK